MKEHYQSCWSCYLGPACLRQIPHAHLLFVVKSRESLFLLKLLLYENRFRIDDDSVLSDAPPSQVELFLGFSCLTYLQLCSLFMDHEFSMCEKLISFIIHLNPNHSLNIHGVHLRNSFLLLYLLESVVIIRLKLQKCLKKLIKF